MLNKKRILLICKETYSYPLYFLAKKLRNNNKVASYFFNPSECMYNECLLNANTYYKYKKLKNVKMYDTKDIAKLFTENINNPPVDFDYIEYIENNYTHYKNINMQLLTTQKMSTYYHNRIYYVDSTYRQQLYWLELNYKKAFKILDTFKPDVIFDLDNSELARSVINEIAYMMGIPYITIEHPRYESYKIPTYSLGVGFDKSLEIVYKEKLSLKNKDLQNEIEYIKQFREKKKIMADEFKNHVTSKYEKDSIITSIKTLIGKAIYFWNQDITTRNLKIKRKNQVIFPNSIKYIMFYAKCEIKKWYLYGKNSLFSDPIKNEKYVYIPLHLMPESTTFVKAPMYINELLIIEQVSKSLPAGWMLYVKEHPAMIGERKLSFYKKVNQLSNVKMVSINYYKDPKPWIINAQGVITITGTSAYEAAMLGKKSIVFGNVPFTLIDGVTSVSSFEELPELLASFGVVDNIKSCAAYIAAVKSVGTEIRLKYLMDEGEEIIKGKKAISDDFQKQVEQLEDFFEKAYEKYYDIIR